MRSMVPRVRPRPILAVGPAPRLRSLLPRSGTAGDNLFLEGDHLGGADLQVHFGPAATWAVPLDDHTAYCIIPHGAGAGVTVSRAGLRSNMLVFGSGRGDDPTRVVRVDPADGLTCVFRDTPVLARLSRAADALSLSASTFRIEDPDGPVSAHVRLSPDRCVVIWRAERLLEPGVEHRVVLDGLLDQRGRPVTPYCSRFVPCTLVRAELG
jgi:hypothetical protein